MCINRLLVAVPRLSMSWNTIPIVLPIPIGLATHKPCTSTSQRVKSHIVGIAGDAIRRQTRSSFHEIRYVHFSPCGNSGHVCFLFYEIYVMFIPHRLIIGAMFVQTNSITSCYEVLDRITITVPASCVAPVMSNPVKQYMSAVSKHATESIGQNGHCRKLLIGSTRTRIHR